ncbi:gluconate 2-dehydrogenase subunit 3 family protein [Falsirhodobacter algicola]|uniref:Gluconate 2-dehydrogenase subunit 3 family protein n=1 Tax=Falsirhodobacter algicola TaxID=2692330 RepID=A0A8J8SM02_9RHOB|nr:gluconate 2-dehydrogenase subunit 3 family protein [Falsirhodobacter algicola]QUS37017.1 gluconate 2-dehydrogenase subunit 3 family protein [Falsirhodobacter algicola]
MTHKPDPTPPLRDIRQTRLGRRGFLGSSAAALAGVAAFRPAHAQTPPATAEYTPEFFNAAQWAFVIAAADTLIPADEYGPSGSEAGVPVFLDRHMQTPYAQGSIWFREGPFDETLGRDFGYQGPLALADIVQTGIDQADAWCRDTRGAGFADLDEEARIAVLTALEKGEPEFARVSASRFFSDFWKELQVGYFADPSWGGNRDQAAWKGIGYPGVRADYSDWVTVREAYPLPPVDLAGNRG